MPSSFLVLLSQARLRPWRIGVKHFPVCLPMPLSQGSARLIEALHDQGHQGQGASQGDQQSNGHQSGQRGCR